MRTVVCILALIGMMFYGYGAVKLFARHLARHLARHQPVVRCKDCRYADDYYHDGSIYCCIPDKPMGWHDDDPNWYCADGERKDGEQYG